jgi:pimeloyl-ACP methyl ester carboxylesterase
VQPPSLLSYPNAVLLISGSKDPISQPPSLQELPKAMAGTVDLRIIEGADHFTWAGHESELSEAVGGFFRKHLP